MPLPLGEALEVLIDHRGRTPRKLGSEFIPEGVPVVSAKNIRDGRLVMNDDMRFVSEDVFERWMPVRLRSGDVLVTSEAPLGEAAYLQLEDDLCLGQRLFALRADETILHARYLYYLLRSSSFRALLAARATGTTAEGIRQSELVKIPLDLPSLDRQREVGDFLGALDDKIDVNRRMVETLEEIARTLFQSWFVDFDPVRGASTVTEDIRRLFPDRIVDSSIGQVPEGWNLARLGDLVDNVRDQVDPRELPPDTPYIGLEHMPRGRIALGEWGSAGTVESGKSIYRVGDILFGKLRPYFRKVGVAPVDGVCSTDILVLRPRHSAYAALCLMVTSSEAFVERADAASTGTRMPRTSWKDMATFPVVVPPPAVCRSFQDAVGPMLSFIIAGIHENRTLAELRDTILPELLSGRIRLANMGDKEN